MGINNRRRRAAMKRKRVSGRRAPDPASAPSWDALNSYAVADLKVAGLVRRLAEKQISEDELTHRTEALLRGLAPIPAHVVETVLADLLARLSDGVVRGGWGPADLAEATRRWADSRHLATLAAVLHGDARENNRRARAWTSAIDAIGPEARLRLGTTPALASGLLVAGLLAAVPLLEPGSLGGRGFDAATSSAEHPKLAQVRALLAKAESTEFDEEAEALSAKAQELITRYALGRLLDQPSSAEDRGAPQVRRVWLDPPYLRAKGALVHEIAHANRCQVALADAFGFCLVVGTAADIDAVELLLTSLLVQANAAMLRHGRRVDQRGAPRTRSFRQSFLLAYAAGIGRRLQAATDAVAAEDGRLLPVLRDHEERVAQAFEAMLGGATVARETRISNAEGWAAGLVAADLAQLDVNRPISGREHGLG